MATSNAAPQEVESDAKFVAPPPMNAAIWIELKFELSSNSVR